MFLENLARDLRVAVRSLVRRPGFTAVEGRPEATPEGGSVTNYRGLMPGYLESMGIPLLAGHMLRPDEGSGSSWVGLVNRNLAERLWPGGSPIGSRVIIDAGSTLNPVEIGGVVGDVKHSSLEDRPVFDLYVPLRQVPPILTKWLALRTYWVLQAEPDPAALAAPARRILADLDPEAAVSNVRSMEEALAATNARRRFQLYLFELSAAAALGLTVTRIYGSTAYAAAQRRREMGIRLALGARRRNILGLGLRDGLVTAAVGIGIGLAAAYAASGLLASLLFQVSGTDLGVYVAVSAAVGLTSLAGSYLPARRATRVDPVSVLRAE
jgi:putative ABC transport system permease protein